MASDTLFIVYLVPLTGHVIRSIHLSTYHMLDASSIPPRPMIVRGQETVVNSAVMRLLFTNPRLPVLAACLENCGTFDCTVAGAPVQPDNVSIHPGTMEVNVGIRDEIDISDGIRRNGTRE